MQKSNSCSLPTECILSPKQLQQRQRRTKTLKKIDSQIQSILSLNKQQHSQYIDFTQKLHAIQNLYIKQNKELREQNKSLSYRYNELQKIYLATKQELQNNIDLLQQALIEKNKLQKEIPKLKNMIKNQQNLIDDYKNSIDDELELQKELIKSTFHQQKLTLQKEFDNALTQMQKYYQDKIKKISQSIKIQNYHHEFQDLKKYLHQNKDKCEQVIKKSSSFLKKNILSEYSTNDRENDKKHNQAIYIP